MQNSYVVERVTIATSKRNTLYLNVTLNDGIERKDAFIWGAKPHHQASDYMHKVVSCDLKEKDGFVSSDLTQCSWSSYDKLPADSILRRVKIKSDITSDMLFDKFKEAMELVTNPLYRKIFVHLKMKSTFDLYSRYPAALKVHHALVGGLAEHIYEMLDMYIALSKTKVFYNVRPEVVIMGIVFHDYGKCFEYDVDKWEVSTVFPLLGHIYVSANYIHQRLIEFNEARKESGDTFMQDIDLQQFVHVILAHHKTLEWGSPVVPCTKEAMVVNYIDEISGKGNEFDNARHMERSYFLGTNIIKHEYERQL